MIKYINNDPEKGIEYNYNKVNKVFKGLEIPKPYDTPLTSFGYDKAWIHVLLSKRNEGKTTNALLYGLCMRKVYPTFTTAYIRQNEKMITMQNTRTLFDVILKFGYVNKIFPEFNTIVYKSKCWYLAEADESGEIIATDETPFLQMFSCDKSDMYKSAVNLPTCDLIVYDEFIPSRGWTHPDEFFWFNDIVKTLLRKRISAHIFLLANNVDLDHLYFSEMDIYQEIHSLQEGEKIVCYNGEMPIYVEWLSRDTPERKDDNKIQISRYFNFRNKKLAAITGGGWAVKEYPRVKLSDDDIKIIKNIYLEVNSNRFLKIDIYVRDKSPFAIIHDTTPPTHSDSLIYSNTSNVGRQYRKGLGFTNIDKFVWSLYKKGKFFYANNSCGSAIESYIKYSGAL